MQPLDILLALPLIWAIWSGWRRGLLVEVVNTVGLLTAIFCGFMLLDTVLLLLRPIFGKATLLPVVAFFAIVAVVFYATYILAVYTKKAINKTLLGQADSLAGSVAAFIKMVLVISTFIWLLGVMRLNIPTRHTKGTFIYPAVQAIGPGFAKGIYVLLPGLKTIPYWIEHTLQPAKPSKEYSMESGATVRFVNNQLTVHSTGHLSIGIS